MSTLALASTSATCTGIAAVLIWLPPGRDHSSGRHSTIPQYDGYWFVDEIGAEEWLRRLLAVLEGEFPVSPDDPTAAYGYTHDV
jgi:hypothetical protein